MLKVVLGPAVGALGMTLLVFGASFIRFELPKSFNGIDVKSCEGGWTLISGVFVLVGPTEASSGSPATRGERAKSMTATPGTNPPDVASFE